MLRAFSWLVTVVVVVGCRSEVKWQRFSSARGGYRVSMPAKAITHVDATAHRAEDVQDDGGLREGAPFVAEESRADRDDDGLYSVRWYEIPLREELSDQAFLERLVAGGKLGAVIPRWIHLGPYVGIEYERIEPEADLLLRSRIFVVEGRVFHLWAQNWIRRDDEPAAQRFLDSFELEATPGLHVTYDLSVSRR